MCIFRSGKPTRGFDRSLEGAEPTVDLTFPTQLSGRENSRCGEKVRKRLSPEKFGRFCPFAASIPMLP